MTESLPLRIARDKVRFLEQAVGWVRAGEATDGQAGAAEVIVLDCSTLTALVKKVWSCCWKDAETGRIKNFDTIGAGLEELFAATGAILGTVVDVAENVRGPESRPVTG